MMFFVYAAIAVAITLIVLVNAQPFKKGVVHYPTTDSIFLILLSLVYVVNIGRDVTSRENSSPYYRALIMLTLLSAVVPLFYIAFFISLWIVTRIKWIHQLAERQRQK